MDNVDIIYNEASYTASLEYLGATLEMQRYNFYKQKVYAFSYATKKEIDTHVYWAYHEMKPRFENNRLFYSRNNKYGATYEKKTKKLKIWFGVPIYSVPPIILENIISHFKIDWFIAMSPSLQSLMNASMLGNIIKGKITNPRDYIKAYLKTSPYKKQDVSIDLFYKTFSSGNINSPKFFRKLLEYSTNINHALEMINSMGHPNSGITDLYEQAAVLNRKVNPKWSDARKKEVHSQWTREIMEIEVKSIKPHNYDYPPIDLPEGFELIQNNYDLFEEGTVMKHCVYTNYEYKIRNKKYFAFRFEKDGVKATLGVEADYYENKPKFNQMYGIGNSIIADEHIEYAKEFINSEYFQNWYKQEVNMTTQENLQPDDFAWL
jgi:hypothetical protein